MDNQDNVREAPHLTLDIHLSYKNNNNLYISKEITDQFLGQKKKTLKQLQNLVQGEKRKSSRFFTPFLFIHMLLKYENVKHNFYK